MMLTMIAVVSIAHHVGPLALLAGAVWLDDLPPKRRCGECGNEYLPTAPNERYCSRVCANAARRKRQARWLRLRRRLLAEKEHHD